MGGELEPKLLGTLAIVVVRAKNLPDRSRLGKQDPYCTFKYAGETKRTKKVVRGGQHPEFDDEVRFAIYEDIEDVLARKKLSDGPDKDGGVAVSSSTGSTGITRSPSKKGIVMQLFADDSKEPKIIGETVIDLTPVLKLGEHDDWYTLSHKDRYAGEVSLELTYFINSAPPMPPKVAKPVKRPVQGGHGTHQVTHSHSVPHGRPLSLGSTGSLKPDGLPPSLAASSSMGYAGPPGGHVDNFERATAMLLNGGNSSASGSAVSYNGQNQQGQPSRRTSYPTSVSSSSLHPVDPNVYPPYRSHSPSVAPPRPVSTSYDPLAASFSSLSVTGTQAPLATYPAAPEYQQYPTQHYGPPPVQALGHRHSQSYGSIAYPPDHHPQQNPPAPQYGTGAPPTQSAGSSAYSTHLPPSTSFPQLNQGYQQSPPPPALPQPPQSHTSVPYQHWQSPPPQPTSSYGPPQPAYVPQPPPQPLQAQVQHVSSPTPLPYSTPLPPPENYLTGTAPYIDNRPPMPSAAPPPPPPPPRPVSTGHYALPTSSFPQHPPPSAPTSGQSYAARPLPMPAPSMGPSLAPSSSETYGQRPPSRQGGAQYPQYAPQPPPPPDNPVDHWYQSTATQPGAYTSQDQCYQQAVPPPPPPMQSSSGPPLPTGASHSRSGRSYLQSLGSSQAQGTQPSHFQTNGTGSSYAGQPEDSSTGVYPPYPPPPPPGQGYPSPPLPPPPGAPPSANQYQQSPQPPTSWYKPPPPLPPSIHPGQY